MPLTQCNTTHFYHPNVWLEPSSFKTMIAHSHCCDASSHGYDKHRIHGAPQNFGSRRSHVHRVRPGLQRERFDENFPRYRKHLVQDVPGVETNKCSQTIDFQVSAKSIQGARRLTAYRQVELPYRANSSKYHFSPACCSISSTP